MKYPTPRTRNAMALAAVALLAGTSPLGAQIAVIVNRANPMTTISIEDLKRIYLGRLSLFPDHKPIDLAESPAVRAVFDDKVLGMNESRVKREWIRLVFAGDGVTPPRAIEQPELLRKFVAQHPGAMAILHSTHADTSVKVLRVNGRLPGDPAYPIRFPIPLEKRQ